MFDIVIIDDDKIARRGIIESIEWEKYNCRIVGEAADGEKGIALIEKMHPHIAIVDIQMPVMDGLGLTRMINEKMPEVKILLLTGYGEFRYAREAMHLGVQHYLLKPVMDEELITHIQEITTKIKEERDALLQIETNRQIITNNLEIVRNHFLIQMLTAPILYDKDFEKRAENLNLHFNGPFYQVLVADIDDYSIIKLSNSHEQLQTLHKQIKNAVDSIFSKNHITYSFFDHDNYLCIIINLPDNHDLSVRNDCVSLQRYVKNQLGISISIAFGNIQNQVTGIQNSFAKAMTAIKCSFQRKKEELIDFKEISDIPTKVTAIIRDEEQHLLESVELQDIEHTEKIISQMFDKLSQKNIGYEQFKNISIRQVIKALISVEDLGIDFYDILGKNASLIDEINQCKNIEAIQIWMEQFFEKLFQIQESVKNSSYNTIIKKAMTYVMKHYPEEIRVDTIADLVYVTPNYFSRIFYQETGTHFVDYLNQYRIERAKLLLADEKLKTYEVAERCGYPNHKYFSFIFKKYENCSPKQYREKIKNRID